MVAVPPLIPLTSPVNSPTVATEVLLLVQNPPVAVVEQDIYALGRTAARMLFDRIDGSRTGRGEHVRIPTRLVPRASGQIRE